MQTTWQNTETQNCRDVFHPLFGGNDVGTMLNLYCSLVKHLQNLCSDLTSIYAYIHTLHVVAEGSILKQMRDIWALKHSIFNEGNFNELRTVQYEDFIHFKHQSTASNVHVTVFLVFLNELILFFIAFFKKMLRHQIDVGVILCCFTFAAVWTVKLVSLMFTIIQMLCFMDSLM